MHEVISKILSRLHVLLRRETYQTYQIGKFVLKLNREHALPAIREKYKTYDRFLPILAFHVHDGVIFDIGANVGDTVLAMLDKQEINDDCTFVCVEPDKEYFNLMKENVKSLDAFHYRQKIILENAFLSTTKEQKTTIKNKGTAKSIYVDSMQHGNNIIPKAIITSFSIPELIMKHNLDFKQLRLIKVDTDGMDYDCIMSLGESLRSISPLIFWEHLIETKEQHSTYAVMFDYLLKMGYCFFVIFDNAGHIMLTLDGAQMKQYHEYLLSVISGRTLTHYGSSYYFDILACKADKINFVLNVLQHYSHFCDELLKNTQMA